jgi:hypothetical protein
VGWRPLEATGSVALPAASGGAAELDARPRPDELNGELIVLGFAAKQDRRADSAKQQMSASG